MKPFIWTMGFSELPSIYQVYYTQKCLSAQPSPFNRLRSLSAELETCVVLIGRVLGKTGPMTVYPRLLRWWDG